MVNVLGVDPSLTCTGLAKTTDAGVILLNRVMTDPAKGLGGTLARVRYIVGQVLKFAPEGDLLTVIETPYVPRRNGAGSVLERGYLFWLLVDQLSRRGAVAAVAPSSRAQYATGSGNASKERVTEAMRVAFPELRVRDDNEADAAALLSMGARWLGAPLDGEISEKQQGALRAVQWPNEREGMQ